MIARKYKLLLRATFGATAFSLAFGAGMALSLAIGTLTVPVASMMWLVAMLAVASTIAVAMIVFAHHALRRSAGSLGRRLGWVFYILIAPWAAMPAYYADNIAPVSAAMAASSEAPEVVLPSPGNTPRNTASFSLGPRA